MAGSHRAGPRDPRRGCHPDPTDLVVARAGGADRRRGGCGVSLGRFDPAAPRRGTGCHRFGSRHRGGDQHGPAGWPRVVGVDQPGGAGQAAAGRAGCITAIHHPCHRHAPARPRTPVTLSPDFTPTETSPVRDLDAVAMSRYLTIARSCWRSPASLPPCIPRPCRMRVARAVTDIELLGASLARKIW